MRRLSWAVIAAALALIALVGVTTANRSTLSTELAAESASAVSSSAATDVAPEEPEWRIAKLACPSHLAYGVAVRCNIQNAVGLEARWSDGHVEEVTSEHFVVHVPAAVGDVTVHLWEDQRIAAAATIRIDPEIDITCDQGPLTEVYELVADDRAEGWNYAYIDPETGERVLPGAEDYPRDPGLTDYELVVLDEQHWTAQCHVASRAIDDLDSTVVWYLDSVWQDEPLRVPIRNLWPFGEHHWNGVQPGDAEVVVTIGDVVVKERVGVYFAGCT